MYTLQGKIRPTRHIRLSHKSTYARRTLPANSPHTWQPFARRRQIWTDPTAHEKKGSRHNPHHAQLTDPRVRTQLLSRASQWSRGHKASSHDDKLLGLSDTYHWHAIGTFNTCSRGPTRRSLTDTGRATTLELSACHILTPRPSQPDVSPFP
jgi:hypothetical protein